MSLKDWSSAKALAVEQGAAGLPLLLDAIEEELRNKAGSEVPDDVEQLPPLFRKLALAAKWERWLLSAAYSGVDSNAALAVITLLEEDSKTASRPALGRDVASLNSGLFLDDDGESRRHWVRLESGGNLEQAQFARTSPGDPIPNVICSKGRYRLRETLIVPKGAELWVERGSIIAPAKGVKLVLRGSLRVFGASAKPVQLGIKAKWGGIKYASEQGLLSDLLIKGAEVGLEMATGKSLYVHNSIIRNCDIGIDNWAGNVWCDDVLCEACSSAGVRMRTNGGHWSFLTNCTFAKNERGVSLVERHRLAIWNCVFQNNKDCAVYANNWGTELRVVNCNFEQAPAKLHAEKTFDLSGNWWRTSSASRAIRYLGGADRGQALFVPPLKKKVRGIGYTPVGVE